MTTNDTETKETEAPRNRTDDSCPLCGEDVDDVTELSERHRQGEIQSIPGRAYDHNGGGVCIEWADGETTRSGL